MRWLFFIGWYHSPVNGKKSGLPLERLPPKFPYKSSQRPESFSQRPTNVPYGMNMFLYKGLLIFNWIGYISKKPPYGRQNLRKRWLQLMSTFLPIPLNRCRTRKVIDIQGISNDFLLNLWRCFHFSSL